LLHAGAVTFDAYHTRPSRTRRKVCVHDVISRACLSVP